MPTTTAQPAASPLLTPQQAADRLAVSVGTLEVWRCTKRYALPWVKIGKCVRYRAEDIDAFITSRTVTPTAIAKAG